MNRKTIGLAVVAALVFSLPVREAGAQAAYRDGDGDGVGAGPRSTACLAETLPAGWVKIGGDADDSDPGVKFGDDEDELALE